MLYAENSLWLSAVILAALLFFRLARGKFSAKLPCIVWLIIALKLVIPWNLPLPQAPHSIEVPVSGQIYIPSVSQMPIGGSNYTPSSRMYLACRCNCIFNSSIIQKLKAQERAEYLFKAGL